MAGRDRPSGLPAVVATGRALAAVPAQLEEIAEAAGIAAVEAIIRRHGGSEIFIPVRAGPGHWLTATVGAEAAERICAHYRVTNADGREIGSVRLYVPQAGTGVIARARRQLLADVRERHLSIREAAHRAGLSERAAYRILAKRRDDRQGELF